MASAVKNQPSTSETKPLSQVQQDLKNLGLDDEDSYVKEDVSTLPTVSVAKEKILADLEEKEKEDGYKPVLSMVVVGRLCFLSIIGAVLKVSVKGHVDAGKSTLMGRMLAELGEMSERAVSNNQRQSEKAGKGSFAYAWAFDALPEERARYAQNLWLMYTANIAVQGCDHRCWHRFFLDPSPQIYVNRRSRTSGFHTQHDFWSFASRYSTTCGGCQHRSIRKRVQRRWTNERARFAGSELWGPAACRGCQQA